MAYSLVDGASSHLFDFVFRFISMPKSSLSFFRKFQQLSLLPPRYFSSLFFSTIVASFEAPNSSSFTPNCKEKIFSESWSLPLLRGALNFRKAWAEQMRKMSDKCERKEPFLGKSCQIVQQILPIMQKNGCAVLVTGKAIQWLTNQNEENVTGDFAQVQKNAMYLLVVERIVMAAQLIHDQVEMECLEEAWETLEGNAKCRFRGTIRFTATSLVHPDEPARTLQRTVEWILPTPTPYRLVEPVQVIEVTSSEEDPEEDLEELPPEPAVDALDFLEGDEDPLLEVDSPEEVMSASEADSMEDSGPGEMAISGGSSS
ncbi:hypothetical protein GmHk_10G028364 [Glycine max]|nr:hypothetical protein GmHk_10G028364 [Glycine max]